MHLSTSFKIANCDELRPGECKVACVAGKQFALYNVAGKFYATENACSHRGGPLGDGELNGEIVTCPWHAWQFNVTTGANSRDCSIKVATYDISVVGDEIRVRL